MKLEELRKMYELPKAPKMEAYVGIDPAFGPGSTVHGIKCGGCGLVMTLEAPLVLRCACGTFHLRGEPCAMCARSHDDEGRMLRIRETGTEKRSVCDQCCYDYYDLLADRFTSEKMT